MQTEMMATWLVPAALYMPNVLTEASEPQAGGEATCGNTISPGRDHECHKASDRGRTEENNSQGTKSGAAPLLLPIFSAHTASMRAPPNTHTEKETLAFSPPELLL